MRVATAVAVLLVTSGASLAQQPAGERSLGVAITEAEEGGFDAAVAAALQAGVSITSLSINWDEAETAPGVFAAEPDWLAIANLYYPKLPLQVQLTLRPVDTNGPHLPADLAGRALDDPVVIRRFLAFVDHCLDATPDLDVPLLAIGNEVDIAFGTDADQWRAFTVLYSAAAAHVRKRRPDQPVGTVLTLPGLTGPTARLARGLVADSDALAVTYYPMRGFVVKDPAQVEDDVRRLLERHPRLPVVFAEAGYPSSAENGSSEALQAEFVRAMFRVWDRYPRRITSLIFCWQTEAPTGAGDFYREYYRLDDPRFLAFLASLGLRHRQGTGKDKPAWRALVEESAARGFEAR